MMVIPRVVHTKLDIYIINGVQSCGIDCTPSIYIDKMVNKCFES